MGRKYFVFTSGLLIAFFSQAIDQLNTTGDYETVHSLIFDDVDPLSVSSELAGETWTNQHLVSLDTGWNDFYQDKAFTPRLTDKSRVRRYKKGYATWVEERVCLDSPYLHEPIRSQVTSRYGRRIHPITGRSHHHSGIDFRGRIGTPVYASASGKVITVRRKGAYGKTVIIDHGNRYSTLYGHLSAYAVKEGQWVNMGQTLGFIGRTGRATGPHLHFEVRCHNVAVNPNQFLRKAGQLAEVRLLKRTRNMSSEPVRRRLAKSREPARDPNYFTRMINMKKLEDMRPKKQF